MKAALFSMDFTGAHVFEGFTSGETWNGWAYPYFSFQIAQHIVKIVGEHQTAFYDERTDEFVFQTLDDEAERFGAVEVENIGKLYPIGAGAWIWERVENDDLANL